MRSARAIRSDVKCCGTDFTQTSHSAARFKQASHCLRVRTRQWLPCTVARPPGTGPRPWKPPPPAPAAGSGSRRSASRAPASSLLVARPLHAQEATGAAPEDREPVLLRQERRPGGRPPAAQGHRGRRAHRRRDRRRHASRRPTATKASARSRRATCSRARPAPRCSGLNVRLGDRLITAQIREKQQARIEYETAKKEGKTAALLEQHLPNVFQMNVANILPGDDVAVELRYTELLVPQRRQLPVRLPDGRRAALQQPAVGATRRRKWVAQPTLRAGVAPNTALQAQGRARHAAAASRRSRSATHAIDVQQARRRPARRRRARAAAASPPTTATSCSTTASPASSIESGLMLYQGQGDERRELLPRDGRAAEVGGRRRDHRRATTSSWSTSRARCTAFRSTPPRRCWSG